MKKLALLMCLTGLTTSLPAQTKTLLNLDKNGVALKGYDPVAFVVQGKPMKGDAAIKTMHEGATYYFASSEDKALFERDPGKYEPAFGGFCAFGVSHNKLVEIDPEAFQVTDGRLLLQYSKSVQTDFNKDTKGNLAKANANWPGLVEKKGK